MKSDILDNALTALIFAAIIAFGYAFFAGKGWLIAGTLGAVLTATAGLWLLMARRERNE